MVKNIYWSSCKVPVFSRPILIKCLDRLSKNTQTSNLMKIPPMGVEFFRAYRQTDRHDEANSRISEFCERA